MSAAHCFYSIKIARIKLIAGHNLAARGDQEGTQVRDVSPRNLKLHENYNPRTKNNDIALLIPTAPFEYNKYVRPACLPSSSSFTVAPGSDCVITGFGTTEHGTSSNAKLGCSVFCLFHLLTNYTNPRRPADNLFFHQHLTKIYSEFYYSAYHQIVTFSDFWEIFENCQLKTLLNSKILQTVTFFDNMNRNDLVVGNVIRNTLIFSIYNKQLSQ